MPAPDHTAKPYRFAAARAANPYEGDNRAVGDALAGELLETHRQGLELAIARTVGAAFELVRTGAPGDLGAGLAAAATRYTSSSAFFSAGAST